MNNYDSLLKAALKEIKLSEAERIPETSEINHTFSPKFEDRMKRFFDKVNENGRYRGDFSALRRAAVVILCVLAASLTITMSNPKTRAEFLNAVVGFYEDHIKFSFSQGEAQVDDFTDIENINITYLPEGFTLKDTTGEYEAKEYTYSDGKNVFSVNISLNDALSILTDKDNSKLEVTEINGRKAYILRSDDDSYSTVIITGSKITVTIYGEITASQAMLIAEGIE